MLLPPPLHPAQTPQNPPNFIIINPSPKNNHVEKKDHFQITSDSQKQPQGKFCLERVALDEDEGISEGGGEGGACFIVETAVCRGSESERAHPVE